MTKKAKKAKKNVPKLKTSQGQKALVKQPPIRFGTISPTMLFRAFILFSALVVATIVAVNGAEGTEFWSFLKYVVIYAALTQQGKV